MSEINFDNIPMKITCVIGQTVLTLKQARELGEGSLIQLDTMAGEPAVIMVNGIPKWKGEVVVVNEMFGVTIKEVLTEDNTSFVMENLVPLVKENE